jgi:hypothetical protein
MRSVARKVRRPAKLGPTLGASDVESRTHCMPAPDDAGTSSAPPVPPTDLSAGKPNRASWPSAYGTSHLRAARLDVCRRTQPAARAQV